MRFLLGDAEPPQYDINEQRFQLDGVTLSFVEAVNYVATFGDTDFPGGRLDCPPLFL